MPQLCPIFWSMFPFILIFVLLTIFGYMEYISNKIVIYDYIMFTCKYKWFW